MSKLQVKHLDPVESIYIKLESGEDLHWFDNKLVDEEFKDHDFEVEFIDGKLYKVTML